jgi:hypothetical protein
LFQTRVTVKFPEEFFLARFKKKPTKKQPQNNPKTTPKQPKKNNQKKYDAISTA